MRDGLQNKSYEQRGFERVLLAAWPTFASAYRGTGAPYITVERASAVLAEIYSAERPELPVAASEVMV